jgi:hypothetical protein
VTIAEVVPMPSERRTRLRQLEAVIAAGWNRVVEVGRALMEIQDEGLYLELGEGLTFKQYVKSRWSLAEPTAYNYIDAAKIDSAIGRADVPVLNERVARELAPLLRSGGTDAVAEAWSKVADRYEGQRPPTAREVHQVLVEEGYRERSFGPSSGTVNRRVKLGQFGDKLAAAEKRLEWFIEKELGEKPLAKADQELALTYADRCTSMARHLRKLAT